MNVNTVKLRYNAFCGSVKFSTRYLWYDISNMVAHQMGQSFAVLYNQACVIAELVILKFYCNNLNAFGW